MKIRAAVARVAGWLRGRRAGADADIRTEFDSHLQFHIDDLVASGVAPAEARRRALAAAGGIDSAVDAYRDRRGLPFVDGLVRDVRYGLRLLARSPGFAAAAVLSLALGIGANTAVFSVIDGLMLRTLPVADADRIVQFIPGDGYLTWSYPLWQQIQQHQDQLGRTFAWGTDALELSRGGAAEPADGLSVDTGFFDSLGVAPFLGRTFNASDDAQPTVAVISYAFWQRHFGGAGNVLGQTLPITSKASFTIVGVTPQAFAGPMIGASYDVAIPLGASPLIHGRDRRDDRQWRYLKVLSRLAPGETRESAERALRALQPAFRLATMPNAPARAQALYLKPPSLVVEAAGGPLNYRAYYKSPLTVLMTLVALVLLIACANIASLLLARADGRRIEVSIRLALGASRARLVRQLFVESLTLAAIGAIAGLGVAAVANRLLVIELGGPGDPLLIGFSLDWRVVLFTAAAATVVAALFGVGPALAATRPSADPSTRLRGRGIVGQARDNWTSAALPVQVAICLTLVVGAGLFVRTFAAMTSRDLGFDPTRLLVVDVSARKSAKLAPARFADFPAILSHVRAVPGVVNATLSSVTPMSSSRWDVLIQNPPGLALGETARTAYKNLIGPEWFATYGVPFIAGRDFASGDFAEHADVAIVNETAARSFFPGANPLGHTLKEEGDVPPVTIVGVVRNVVDYDVTAAVTPTLYEPIAPAPTVSLTVAAAADPTALSRSVEAAVGEVDAGLTLEARPLTRDLDQLWIRERTLAHVSGFFGVLALLLAAVGIYGVVSYAVGRRQQEIGIRLALGSSRLGVVAVVARRALTLVAIGIVAGLAISSWASRFVASELYGLAPRDPVTLASAALLLLAVAAVAGWWPSRRAARVDPARVLRQG
jgi:predicted permease